MMVPFSCRLACWVGQERRRVEEAHEGYGDFGGFWKAMELSCGIKYFRSYEELDDRAGWKLVLHGKSINEST